MKKSGILFLSLLLLLSFSNLQAQTAVTKDNFVGKWQVIVRGTPQGDVKMIFTFEKKDTVLTGTLTDTTGKEISPIAKIDFEKEQISVYFNASGYDLILTMGKKDEDHLTGSLLGMFDAEGERVKI